VHGIATGLMIVVVVFTCIIVDHWVGRQVLRETLDTELRAIARIAAARVDPALHAQLTDPSQQNGELYSQIVAPLREILTHSDHYTYIYTLKKIDGKWSFVADAATPGDADGDGVEDQATMFEAMEEPEPVIDITAETKSAQVSEAPYSDKWGTFITAYSPVFRQDGSIECIVGVDSEANNYMARLARMTRASVFAGAIGLAAGITLGVCVYIVQRRRDLAERRVIASEQFLEGVGAVAGVGGWELDLTTQSLHWTSQTRRIHEVHADHVPTVDSAVAFYTPEARHQISAAVAACSTHGTPFDLELPLVTATGRNIWVRAVGQADQMTGKITRIHGAFQDITRKVEAENAIRRALSNAEAATRAKSDFLANTSHEIRTPMTAILGFADLLADELSAEQLWSSDSRNRRVGYIDIIRRSGNHLLAIINDILDLSKIEAGKFTIEASQTHLDQMLADVMNLMRGRATAKGIDLCLEFATPVPKTIQTDGVRLKQIFVNLIGNAIKFTETGQVTVRLALSAPSSAGPGATPAHPLLTIQIIDTGMGMTADQLHRLFRPFEQADASMTRRFGGTGLGLCISRRLAEMLGGTIEAQSQPGQGSTFTLTVATGDVTHIPLITSCNNASATTPAPQPHPTPEGDAPLAGLRILLAEDGIDNQRLISLHLRRAGAVVTIADNGKLALQHLTTTGTPEGPLLQPLPIDLLITDMQMPEMDGYTLARQLRTKGFNLGIIALTAHAMTGDAERCLAAGCNGYASKPVDRQALIALSLQHARSIPAPSDATATPTAPPSRSAA
jgi:signal transduction histidine kinase/CheY-like chemotaxis protein